MTRTLAIDPGSTQSAWVLVDDRTRKPLDFAKYDNDELRIELPHIDATRVVIEMVASYGMAVGAEVFDTCVWIGRFVERSPVPAVLVYRQPVKLHHCHTTKAKDSNVVQALVDRFAPGQPNRGKGTKVAPGWFHGFRADIWQAYALAVFDVDYQEVPF